MSFELEYMEYAQKWHGWEDAGNQNCHSPICHDTQDIKPSNVKQQTWYVHTMKEDETETQATNVVNETLIPMSKIGHCSPNNAKKLKANIERLQF